MKIIMNTILYGLLLVELLNNASMKKTAMSFFPTIMDDILVFQNKTPVVYKTSTVFVDNYIDYRSHDSHIYTSQQMDIMKKLMHWMFLV